MANITTNNVDKKHLNAGVDIDEMKRQMGGDRLRLVAVDEVSMLQANFLILLDRQLRAMYEAPTALRGILKASKEIV
jgi:hypothetical protein